MITPYTEDGKIDYPTLKALIGISCAVRALLNPSIVALRIPGGTRPVLAAPDEWRCCLP